MHATIPGKMNSHHNNIKHFEWLSLDPPLPPQYQGRQTASTTIAPHDGNPSYEDGDLLNTRVFF